ncbi:MAG TPA: hypothetical protein VL294_04790 [Pseudolysinimonas sp.]|nr:hypothetical protein [Pseudolysinimonas sp.]
MAALSPHHRYGFSVPSKHEVDPTWFNPDFEYPWELRQGDFTLAMQDVYDFFGDVNQMLRGRNLQRLDDMLRPANMSGMISDMLTDSLAKHSRALVNNNHHNGHPDLLSRGKYPGDSVESGEFGVEVKSTQKAGGAVDTHGARDQWMCVFVYSVDNETEPVDRRAPMTFREIYLGKVERADFRLNRRLSDTGTRTATLHADGLKKLRPFWVYLDPDWATPTRGFLAKLRE